MSDDASESVSFTLGISICDGGGTSGEKRPDSIERRRELVGVYEEEVDSLAAGEVTGSVDSCSWDESSSSEK